jgi:hypothetical protein
MMERKAKLREPLSPSLDNKYFRLLHASLLYVHLLNLLFHDANGLVEPVRAATHPLDFDCRKPLAGVLLGLAQRLEMPASTRNGR